MLYSEGSPRILIKCRLLVLVRISLIHAICPNLDNKGAGAESAMLVASLREVIQNQAKQIEDLQNKLKDAQASPKDDVRSFAPTSGISLMSMPFLDRLPL